MGNEHSKNKEATKNGIIPEKHENGALNGLSANITSIGLEIGVTSENIIQQNGKPTSLNPDTESNDPENVIVESDCQHVDAEVISATPDTTVQTEEGEENKEEQNNETSNEGQTDGSLPATDPEPESDSSGEEAAATIIIEHPEEFECLHQTAEISTQTDMKTEADTSTQTGDDSDSTTITEGPMEEVAVMETATTEEHSLNESAVIIAEEVVEDTANEEPLDNQTAVIIITEVHIENNVYENIVFRAERVEVTDKFEISHIKNYNPEEDSINGPEETGPEITTEPESNPNASIIVDEIAGEENMIEERVPLEVSSSLPKVVADCIEAVFAAVSESGDYTAVNTSEPRVDEVITEDSGEGAGDMSADVALIETAEPEPNAVTPEAKEANGVPSLDGEPVIKVMETIFEVVYEKPNATPGDQDMPVEEPSVPLETEIVVKMESAHEEVAANDAVAVEDVPEKLSPVSDDEPSEKKCDSCPEEETTVGGIVEAPSKENQLITIVELPEDSLTSTDDDLQIKLQSIPEIIVTEVDVGVDVIADVASETVEESEVRSAIVKEDAEVILEAAIDALSQQLEPSAVSPLEPAADNASPFEEEIFAATVFVPLSAEQEASLAIPQEPTEETIIPSKEEIVAEEMKEEAIQALSNEFEAVPQSVDEDIAVQETSTEGEVAILEEPVEESDMAQEKTEVSEDEPLTEATEEPVGETIIPSKEEIVAEEMKEEAIQALSNEFEAVPQSVDEDTAVQETSTEGVVAISEQPVDESDVAQEKTEISEDEPLMEATEEHVEPIEENVAPAEMLLKDVDKEAVTPSVVAVEVLESSPVVSEEAMEESVRLWRREQQPKGGALVVILETIEDYFTEEIIQEIDCSGDVLAAVADNTEYSQIAADESVAACVEAIVEEIITDYIVEAECSPVTSEEVAPEIVTEAEEKAEDESSVNTTVPSPDRQENMEAVLVKLQLACASVVEESAYKLGGVMISSLGYSITVTIHVAPKREH